MESNFIRADILADKIGIKEQIIRDRTPISYKRSSGLYINENYYSKYFTDSNSKSKISSIKLLFYFIVGVDLFPILIKYFESNIGKSNHQLFLPPILLTGLLFISVIFVFEVPSRIRPYFLTLKNYGFLSPNNLGWSRIIDTTAIPLFYLFWLLELLIYYLNSLLFLSAGLDELNSILFQSARLLVKGLAYLALLATTTINYFKINKQALSVLDNYSKGNWRSILANFIDQKFEDLLIIIDALMYDPLKFIFIIFRLQTLWSDNVYLFVRFILINIAIIIILR